MFTCQQASPFVKWKVHLPDITLINSVYSSQAGRVSTFLNDPGFGFQLHVLPSSVIIYELNVTAVKQLDGVTVECIASEMFMSTIQIDPVPG